MLFRKILREFKNSLRFRALYGIILRVMFSEKVHEVLHTFVKNFTMHALFANDIAWIIIIIIICI